MSEITESYDFNALIMRLTYEINYINISKLCNTMWQRMLPKGEMVRTKPKLKYHLLLIKSDLGV